MGQVMSEVDEEGFGSIRFDEFDGLIGISLGDGVLVRWAFDDGGIVDDGNLELFDWSNVVGILLTFRAISWKSFLGIHVIGVGNAPVRIESMISRQMLFQMS